MPAATATPHSSPSRRGAADLGLPALPEEAPPEGPPRASRGGPAPPAPPGPPGLPGLHRRAAEFQRALEALAAEHAAQLADLEVLLSQDDGASPHRRTLSGSEGRVTFDESRPPPSTPADTDVGKASLKASPSQQSLKGSPTEFLERRSSTGNLGLGRSSVITESGALVELHERWGRWELRDTSKSMPGGSDQYVSECGARPTVCRSRFSVERSQTLFMGRVFQDGHPVLKLIVMKPGSVQHLAHALACLGVIMYDIMSLPLVLAFQLEDLAAVEIMDTLATVFWTWDFANNFRTGYAEADHNELRLRKIASRYLRTWFVYDAFLVSFDWFTYAMRDRRGLGAARIVRSPRIVRVLFRALRLLRVVKLTILLEDVLSYITSEWLSCTVSVVKLLVGLVVFNHFVACFWYLIGDATTSSIHGSWTSHLDTADAPFSTAHRYLLSFHWSMCQYTPAPNDYHPKNAWERFYACVMLLFGIAVFSAFLGKITSLLTHMSAAAYDRSKNERFMRRFLVGNMITLEVASRITTFLSKRQTKNQVVSYSEVTNFVELPASLATELKKEAYCRCLQRHALVDCLLTSYERAHNSFVFRICILGLRELAMKWGDELLTQSGLATSTVFVKDGRLEYASKMDSIDWPTSAITIVGPNCPKKWACEMALWCAWHCRGHLCARIPCISLVVDADDFHKIARRNASVFGHLQAYAEAYARRLLVDLEDPSASLAVDDLWGQEDDARRLVDEVFDFTDGGEAPDDCDGRRVSVGSEGSLASAAAAGYRRVCRFLGREPGVEAS